MAPEAVESVSEVRGDLRDSGEQEREGRYSPNELEPRWAAAWASEPALFAADGPDEGKPKYYVLEMLPYPSGALHIGHVRNYAIGDALARYKWMRGHNVLHPMGWDAFGLPAENAALKNHTHPREWTLKNIAAMKTQFNRLGMAFDWSREVTTCFPEYYRWNQWFFLKMFAAGLAYRKKSCVNWCNKCQTVLANEQVIDGRCWRHEDEIVVQKELEQWFLRTTRYAGELLDGLDKLDGWPDRVRLMQRNWIGRSEGTMVDFTVMDSATHVVNPGDEAQLKDLPKITIFTTRVDTIYGATSLQLAPTHPLVQQWLTTDHKLAKAVQDMTAEQDLAREAGKLDELGKHGVFTGHYARNPFSGENIPIWAANYVLMDYGTGAIMSVPAHDERDYEFAQKYGLEVQVVVLPRREEGENGKPDKHGHENLLPFTGEDSLLMNSGPFNMLGCEEAQTRMSAYAEEHGYGKRTVNYRLRDWGVSRQRPWGTPIPMLYCAKCGVVPVPEDQLPVLLPETWDYRQPGSPLKNIPEFVNTTCPKCGGPATRETDTMDTFVDSSWYFYRYTDPKNDTAPFASDLVAKWFEIDQYIGGVEHAILHLIYSRFWTKMMRDLGLVKNDEPVAHQFSQGMVIKDGAKMSKSKGNVVSPDDMVARYGADATRMYALFAAPPDRDLDWQEEGVSGVSRFLSKVYRLSLRLAPHAGDSGAEPGTLQPELRADLLRKLHQTIGKLTDEFEDRWHFNTCISALMEYVNDLLAAEPALVAARNEGETIRHLLDNLVRMLAPFAPFLAQELWHRTGNAGQVLRAPWPEANPLLATDQYWDIPVQVNGKLRNVVRIPVHSDEGTMLNVALGDAKVAAAVDGRTVLRQVVVPGKLVNLVVK